MRRTDPRLDLRFAAIDGGRGPQEYAADVSWRVTQGDPLSYARLARRVNAADVDVVLIQHEFGLYGTWGSTFDDHLSPFLDMVRAPVVSILHSVPPEPSPSVRAAVRRLGRRGEQIVVMAHFARRLLIDRYGVEAGLITVIPHGVPDPPVIERASVRRLLGVAGRQLITTFGFLDPHKGLEHMIAAMSTVADRFPRSQYVIVGRTHPDLAHRDGEAYRRELESEVASRGLQGSVAFVDAYVSLDEIVAYLAASDVYVTPYLDMNQVTSGTLAYALGQGRAVVSTPYIHAVEALADGRGVIVPPADSTALAEWISELLSRPGYRRDMERRARAYGASMAWPLVGAQTLAVLRRAAQLDGPSEPVPVPPASAPTIAGATRYRGRLGEQRRAFAATRG